MSGWNKQNWIKDILSKSGTEITEINEDKSDEGLFNSIKLFTNCSSQIFFFGKPQKLAESQFYRRNEKGFPEKKK